MRTIQDAEGRIWDIAVGKESYGVRVLIFSVRGVRDIRKHAMAAGSTLAATQELESLSDAELRVLLGRAEPWA
ncbi:MAG TPA: hypothetical protein VGA00_04685 [Acidiferrobacterales bacterium]|jgi:hypothetical protein